jgi:hypothetical protein
MFLAADTAFRGAPRTPPPKPRTSGVDGITIDGVVMAAARIVLEPIFEAEAANGACATRVQPPSVRAPRSQVHPFG